MNNKNSKILLCKDIDLDRDYNNVIDYTEQQMIELCSSPSHLVRQANNFSFIRIDGNEIQVDFPYRECLLSNYIAFQNPNYSNKWFFAFVDKVSYVGENTTKISFTIDVHSTWFDYWDSKPCFVMREHTNDDSIGANTLPEGLELGEYVINTTGDVETDLDSTILHCLGVSWLPDNTPFITDNRIYGKVYSGVYYLLFRFTESLAKFIRVMDAWGHSNDIVELFEIPLVVADTEYDTGWSHGDAEGYTNIEFKILKNQTYKTLRDDITLTSPNSLNGYIPRNKKLYTAPYNMLSITNNIGIQTEYHYEDFINNTPIFSLISTPTSSCSIWLFPNNYKKSDVVKSGYNYGMPIAKYPQGSWNNDMYVNYMTQNGVNWFGHNIDPFTAKAIRGSIELARGGINMNFENIGDGLGAMLGAVQESYRASMIPNQIGGQTSAGNIQFAYGKMSPTYYKMSIKAEYARIIDDWFTRFGYKTNRIKNPNITGRENFNYVQIGATEEIGFSNSLGSVPTSYMEEINRIYRKGVCIWHNHENVGNYLISNNII